MEAMKNSKALSLEDIKFFLEKVHAAQQAGHSIVFSCNNYSITIHAMIGEFSEGKEWDEYFYMYNDAPGVQRAIYKKCIAYLEKLAGEK